MKSKLLLIFLIVFSNSYSQTYLKIDSLKKIIDSPKIKNNSVQEKVLLDLNKIFDAQFNLIDTDRDSAKIIFKQIDPLLKSLKNDILDFRYNHEWSRIYYLDSEYQKGLNKAKKALNISKKLQNKMFETRATRLMMVMSHRLNMETEAMKYATITANLIENSIDSLLISSTYNSLSSFYSDCGIIEKALRFSLKAIESAKKYKDIKGLLGGMNNAAVAYMTLNRYDKAEEVLKEQIKIAIQRNKPKSLERAYANLCEIFILTDNIKQLNVYFPRFKKIVEEHKDEIMKLDNWSNFYDQEAKYHLYNLRFKSAEESINKGVKFAEKSSYKNQLLNVYSTKSEILTASHRFSEATVYYEKTDSIEKNFEKLALIKYGEDLETKYKLTQKQNEILQKDIALQKSKNNLWLLGGGFLVMAILAGLGFFSFRKKQQNKALIAEIETQKAERSRIATEMHDELGGNLTSLMYMAHQLKMESPENVKVNKILDASSDISSNINEIIWSLNHEKNSLNDWVVYTKGKLIEMLENSDQNYSFEIQENIPDKKLSDILKRNLYLAVKEITNNAVKHSKAEKIIIYMNFENEIAIKITDNGSGSGENFEPKPGSGNGINNIKQRIAALGGTVEWKNKNGTEVNISIPLT